MQYRYTIRADVRADIQSQNPAGFQGKGFGKVDARDATFKKKFCEAVRRSFANSAFEQENKYSLQIFYTPELENVYPMTARRIIVCLFGEINFGALKKRNCISRHSPMHRKIER